MKEQSGCPLDFVLSSRLSLILCLRAGRLHEYKDSRHPMFGCLIQTILRLVIECVVRDILDMMANDVLKTYNTPLPPPRLCP